MIIEDRNSKNNYLLSNEALLIYILILQTMTIRNYCSFSINQLLDVLYTDRNQTKMIKKIRSCLLELKEVKIISFYKDRFLENEIDNIKNMKKGEIYFAEIRYIFDDNFFIVYDDEIKKILEYCSGKKNIDKFKLIGYFCYLIMRMNKENKICYPSFDKIEFDVGIGTKAIMSYNTILKELKLINYINSGYRIIKGKIKQDINYYCRYEDRDYLKEYVEKFKENSNLNNQTTSQKKKSNKKRSLKQKINYLKKNGKTEEMERLQSIYNSL